MPRQNNKLTKARLQKRNVKPSPAKPSSSSNSQARFWKRIYLVVLIGVPLLLLVLFPLWFNLFVRQDIRIPEITDKMTLHLETKYDQLFTVTNAHYTNFGLGMTGIWQAEAHPKDNNSLIFRVGSNNDATTFTDEYPGAVWTAQEQDNVRSFLKTVFGFIPAFEFNVNANNTLTRNIKGRVPSFEDTLKSHAGVLVYIIRIKIDGNFNDQVEQHSSNLIKLVEYVKAKGVGTPQVKYTVNLTDENARYTCSLSGEELDNISDVRECFRKYQGRE